MTDAQSRRQQKGFTLIEVIAVLIILGILVSVAAPRYMDMMDNARTRAVSGALAECNTRVTMAFANALLNNAATKYEGLDFTNMGDFTVTATPATADVDTLPALSIAFDGSTYTANPTAGADANEPGRYESAAAAAAS